MPRTRTQRPIEYRDRRDRVWYVSEVARLRVVSAAIAKDALSPVRRTSPRRCRAANLQVSGRLARRTGGRRSESSLRAILTPPATEFGQTHSCVSKELAAFNELLKQRSIPNEIVRPRPTSQAMR